MTQGIWTYADRLDSPPPAPFRVTLGEGGTPLLRSRRIGPAAGLAALYFKLESANPTGSYKDRFAVAAVSEMLARGKTRCLATSSGNTGASLAAACAVAGIPLHLAIVEPAPADKLRQMLAYGARLRRIRGFGLDPEATAATFGGLRRLGERPGWSLEISAYAQSPVGMSGVETIAFELAEQLTEGIGHVFAPAGGGGLCLAVARGFAKSGASPAVHCVQPLGNDTIAGPLREGRDHGRRADPCLTTISGLQVPNLLDANAVIAACRASGGTGQLVADEEVYALQARLAREEGVFAEPAGAVALAGALRAAAAGEIDPGAPVVCLVTGSGFKDGASLARIAGEEGAALVDFEEFAGSLPA
jgi:threonine synthase